MFKYTQTVSISYDDGTIEIFKDVESIKALEIGFLELNFMNNDTKLISLRNVRRIYKTI